MNENHSHPNDEIRDLLVEAGPPVELPAADLERIRTAARREWLSQSGTPIFEGRSYRPLLAMAASLLLVVTAIWLYRSGRQPLATAAVATVELLRAEGATESRFGVGDQLAAGTEISTIGDSPIRVALRMASGHSIRVDSDSRVRLASAQRLELERGAVYIDSGAEGASDGLEIGTPLGTVREIGTQYEVRLNGGMRVRVREGSVSVDHSGGTFSASRGEQLLVDSGGEVVRSPVTLTGPTWSWVLDTAPSPDIEGRSLGAYLDWIARETGWQIAYEEASLERYATETVYGSIEGMTPEESLRAVLSSSGLGYRLDGETLVIGRR